jgi:hypothetical protein
MSREILDRPHPTPNPDGPHTATSKRVSDTGDGTTGRLPDEPALDRAACSAGTDDLAMILAGVEPDPALKSGSSADTISPPHVSTENEPAAELVGIQAQSPRTSEVFQTFGPQGAFAVEAIVASEPAIDPELIRNLPGGDSVFDRGLIETAEPTAVATKARDAAELAADDDQGAESHIPWGLLLLMSYSSAVTLALTWFLWTGRSFSAPGAPLGNVSSAEPETVPKIVSQMASAGELPPLPEENLAALGQTVQIGELEVTPVEISLSPVSLVRSINQSDWRREDEPSLVLKLRLKNTSKAHSFAPLERRFLREQSISYDRSMIVTSQSKVIPLFSLAVESEWSIEGETFGVLKPEETAETVIASEPGVAGKLADDMTWRIRVRIGTYRRDVLGVRFHNYDVKEAQAE